MLLAPGAQRRVVVGEDGERARDEDAGAGDGDADLNRPKNAFFQRDLFQDVLFANF